MTVTVNGCNMFDMTFVLKVLGLKTATQNPWKTNPRYTGLPKKNCAISIDLSNGTSRFFWSYTFALSLSFRKNKIQSFVFEL